jgi:hypothetical protein
LVSVLIVHERRLSPVTFQHAQVAGATAHATVRSTRRAHGIVSRASAAHYFVGFWKMCTAMLCTASATCRNDAGGARRIRDGLTGPSRIGDCLRLNAMINVYTSKTVLATSRLRDRIRPTYGLACRRSV